jgi:hypothetical protein
MRGEMDERRKREKKKYESQSTPERKFGEKHY